MPFSTTSPSSKASYRHCDKNNLMNEICNSLDLCCAYIQALNSLCGAGSSLARNLFLAVQEVPAFQNVSLQFLSIWEEVSKATAGASAAVKTETLMMLQEILNSLEMSKSEADTEKTIAESFQAIGTCLCSFIELQAQFSLSTWKSLSKLSKHFTSDSMRHSLQWKSLDRTPSKIAVNSELNSTIKKHYSRLFSKVGISKVTDHIDISPNHFYSPPNQGATTIPLFSPFGNQSVPENIVDDSVWSPPTTSWSPTNSTEIHFSEGSQLSKKDAITTSSNTSDLDDVINLLSCVPVQPSFNKLNSQNQNYFQYPSNSSQVYHHLPKASVTHVSRCLSSQRSWPKDSRDVSNPHDNCLWRMDGMNCSALPLNSTDIINLQCQRNSDLQAQWDSHEIQKWNTSMCETGSSSDDGSSVHGSEFDFFSSGMNSAFGKPMNSFSNRKQSSGESMPGGLENISESKEEYQWVVQSKINTWPLKQSGFRSSDSENQDNSEYSEYQHPYMSTS